MIESQKTTNQEKSGGDTIGQEKQTQKNSNAGSLGRNADSEQNASQTLGNDNKKCVTEDNYKYEIEKENWKEQLALLETEHDVNLKKCLQTARDDIIKFIDGAKDVKKKYSDEYKKLKDEYDCKEKNNSTDVGKIPRDRKTELEDMLKEIHQKIFNLGQCKSKLKCIELGAATGQSQETTSAQSKGKEQTQKENLPRPKCTAYDYDTFKSCDMSQYIVLTEKKEIKLECEKDKVKGLKPLQIVSYELEKSNRYNEEINYEYTQLKETQKNISDIFKKVDDYQKKIEALSAEEKCNKWVYVLLIKNLLIDSCHKLLEPETFNSDLENKIKEIEKAKKDLCYRTYNKDKTEALLKFVTGNYETLQKDIEKNALDRLSDE